ncbi:HD domain-containing protein [Candidatus Woesearchaeota archaeon]|nr:HD domain-containing protein [Candidatus Woesearchaeota archaeon]
MKLPSKEECYALLATYKVPGHVIRHSEAVCRVAVFLAKRLKDKGMALDVQLVERAALLHDLLKTIDFQDFNASFGDKPSSQEIAFWQELKVKYKGMKHETAAYLLLKERYPQIAHVILTHRYSAILTEDERPKTWEEKLVYYADKRVKHDTIVSLQERFEDGRKRYGRLKTKEEQETTARIEHAIVMLEQEIFNPLGITPNQLVEEMQHAS